VFSVLRSLPEDLCDFEMLLWGSVSPFYQEPPGLGNQYDADPLLREYMHRTLPAELLARFEDEYRELGELAGGELYRESLADLHHEPVLTTWDAWGRRIDHIELTSVWKRAQRLSAELGLVAAGYDVDLGPYARVHQFLMNYLVQASLDTYSCPLAMTDGAARTLLQAGNQALIERAVERLLSRDPETMWTSGQWMTERVGGSDVSQTETVARRDGEQWRLHGTKWFTSATSSDMALTLARPEGNPAGSRGLALFYLELRDEEGRLQNIAINRLKDKLGTRKLPTAELSLEGAPAIAVSGLEQGVRNIAPMLGITRTWNAVAAAWGARRAVALAQDYARRRKVFGKPLMEQPLHVDTLAGLEAEAQAVFLLAFRVVELLGRVEAGEASPQEERLLRLLTSIAKLTTGKQGVAVASEVVESFGGAGYVNDTGLPRLLTDAQVLSIWEGTTNVLSIDALRALREEGVWEAFVSEVEGQLGPVQDSRLALLAEQARSSMRQAEQWLAETRPNREALEAGARRFALSLGRTLQLALLVQHAQWSLAEAIGERALTIATRFAAETGTRSTLLSV
jgi:acyl-CoA dehydrogenase